MNIEEISVQTNEIQKTLTDSKKKIEDEYNRRIVDAQEWLEEKLSNIEKLYRDIPDVLEQKKIEATDKFNKKVKKAEDWLTNKIESLEDRANSKINEITNRIQEAIKLDQLNNIKAQEEDKKKNLEMRAEILLKHRK